MVMFFQNVGLTAQDVAIKVSSRQLLQAVLEQHMVPAESTSRVFVTVDKMDKLPQETVSHISILLGRTTLCQCWLVSLQCSLVRCTVSESSCALVSAAVITDSSVCLISLLHTGLRHLQEGRFCCLHIYAEELGHLRSLHDRCVNKTAGP